MTDEQRKASIQALNDIIKARGQKSTGSSSSSSKSNSKLNRPQPKGHMNKEAIRKLLDEIDKSDSGDKDSTKRGLSDIGGNPEDSDFQKAEQEARLKEIEDEIKEYGEDYSLDGVEDADVDAAKIMDEIRGDLYKKELKFDNIEGKRNFNKKLRKDNKNDVSNQSIPTKSVADIAIEIKDFMKNEIGKNRGKQKTWSRVPRRSDNSGVHLLRKGTKRTRVENQEVPSVLFYFDQSGSWGSNDIKKGYTVVNKLKEYADNGDLKVEVYYFADDIADSPDDLWSTGTSASQKILDHAKAHGADNVIIMTDDDMDDAGYFSTPLEVRGGVWFLFKKAPCKRIMEYLRGRKRTKAYMLDF